MALPKILTHSQREQAAATGLQIRAAVPAAACLVDGEDHRKRPQALHGVTYCGDALPADGDSTLQSSFAWTSMLETMEAAWW